jgi:subtilisin family serine protease
MPIRRNFVRRILLFGLASILLSLAVDAVRASEPGAPHRPGQVLVRFRDGASIAARGRAHAARGAVTVKRYRFSPTLERVRVPADMTVGEAVAAYAADSEVLWAEPDWVVEANLLPTDETQFTRQWGLRNVGQDLSDETSIPVLPGADISAPEAWDITTGDRDVIVAVIDSGSNLLHPDLAPNLFRNEADCDLDQVDDDGNGYADDCHGIDTVYDDSEPLDDNGHGTHVAGIIGAAAGNGFGTVGVAWDVQLLICKFLDGLGRGFISDAVECFDYIASLRARGFRVVASNNSWGGRSYSHALSDAIRRQLEAGILLVAAAGNSAADVGVFLFRPAGLYLPNVIAVAASAPNDTIASFSNHGRHSVHLSAPGVAILSSFHGTWGHLNGTSMAAPFVTGVAALLSAQDAGRDWRALRNLLLTSAAPIAESDKRTITGGRLDAHAALTCSGRTVTGRVAPTSDAVLVSPEVPLGLAVLNLDCADPAGPVSVTVSPGDETVELADDGSGFDQVAGDGTYSAYWTPPAVGSYAIDFPDGELEVTAGAGVVAAPLPGQGDQFGWAVAGLGDDFVVGAPGDSSTLPGAGAIHIVDGASARVVATYPNPEPLGGDAFGLAIAVDGDRILVGAPWASRGAPASGSAFLLDALTGALLARFDAPLPGLNASFGTAVGFVGGLIAVGEPFADAVNRDSGRIHLFEASGELVVTLPPTLGHPPFLFGYDVVASANALFVSNGSADVWASRIDADPESSAFGTEIAWFAGLPIIAYGAGRTVEVAPPWVLVGEPLALLGPTEDAIGAGLVSVSDMTTAMPHPVLPQIRPPEQREFDNFGQSLAADGDRVYVGAPFAETYDETGQRDGFGAVLVFDLTAGGYVRRYERPVHGFDDGFGSAVAVAGERVAIGAPADRDAGPTAGAVYLFPVATEPAIIAPQLYGCNRARKDSPQRRPFLEYPRPGGTTRLSLEKHDRLCVPAREVGRVSPDFAMSLACYGTSSKPEKRETTLRTTVADERLVLSGKTVGCIPARETGTATVLTRRAWVCQKAKRKGPSTAPRRFPLVLERPAPPPYFQVSYHADVTRPTMACTEVDLDSPAPLPVERRLVCYRAKSESTAGHGYAAFDTLLSSTADGYHMRGLDTVCMQATEIADL